MNKQQNSFVSQFRDDIKSKQYTKFTAEVVDIVLDSSHPKYNSNHSIGMIEFKSYYGGMNGYAMPLNLYDNITPILHESVLIIQGTAYNAGVADEALKYYYTDPINVWNIINCNLVPFSTRDVNNLNPPKSEQYNSFTGIEPLSPAISYGKYFKEKLYIPKLLPFEGDIIHQGRWGQSIRFGSITQKNQNIWSSKGELGRPLMIMRVNQQMSTKVNDIEVEDINKDASSIYMCDNVLIPLNISSSSRISYKYKNNKIKLIDPKNYLGKQLLLSSDRIILNTKTDGIILSAASQILLTSKQTVNIEADTQLIMDSPEIILGSKAESHAVLGEQVKDILGDMNSALSSLCKLLSTINTIGSPTAQTLSPKLVVDFSQLGIQFNTIKTKLDTILSKKIIIE